MTVPRSRGTSDHQALCDLLRDVRQQKSLTQVEVASRLGRPQSFVSKYETGERRLDIIELGEVCGALGLPLNRVVNEWEKRRTSR